MPDSRANTVGRFACWTVGRAPASIRFLAGWAVDWPPENWHVSECGDDRRMRHGTCSGRRDRSKALHALRPVSPAPSSRLGDGLDGALARIRGKTDLGGYLDIVLDFVFYGAIPLGFVIADPQANAVAGAVLIFSFYVNGASFLAYSIIAEKRKMETSVRGEKSIFFTAGLAEATETIAVFVAFCLFPAWFPQIAYTFAAVCSILRHRGSFWPAGPSAAGDVKP